ncbi:hypothetical protein CF319_g6069 [Tilletia indica]|nr:hypothetical protein CF319_g6069 [Tilletia indica]
MAGPGDVSSAGSLRYSPIGAGPSSRSSMLSTTASALSSSAGSSSALTAALPHQEPAQSGKAPRRRNRAVLSCLKCHQRRVKCDRKAPCTACVRYGCADECRVPDNPKARQHRQHRVDSLGSNESDDFEMEEEQIGDNGDVGDQPGAAVATAVPSYHNQEATGSNAANLSGAHDSVLSDFQPYASPSSQYQDQPAQPSSGDLATVYLRNPSSARSREASGSGPAPTIPSQPLDSSSISQAAAMPKRSYTTHHSADVLNRFISEYEGHCGTVPANRSERVPKSYSHEHVEEIWSFCENLPSRNLDILIGSYLNDVDWMYQIVDADAVIYGLLPDLVFRILDPRLTFTTRPQEWASALRWGDMTRLSLLGGMILGSVQATGETVLKLTFKQAGEPNAAAVGNSLPGSVRLAGDLSSHDSGFSSAQSVLSGASSAQNSGGSDRLANRSRNAPSVKTEVLSVLEGQVRRLLHLATMIEGPSSELVKARMILLNFIKNEARLAEPETHQFLEDTVKITMEAEMHKDPGSLQISDEEKEDRRRLFCNLYAFDRFAALFFGKRPAFPEEEITSQLPQERSIINGKENLYTFLLLKAQLGKIVTRIALAALEVPVEGDKISQLEVGLQDFSKMTQGTPFHTSLPQIPPELRQFHTLDRQRHLYLICFHSVREALHRLAFFQGPMITAQHARYSREACAQSAVVLLETQRSLRLRIFSSGDLCCFYIPFFNLEPAITLIISAIVTLQAEPAQGEVDYVRNLPVKKAKVDYYMQWAQHALDLLRSMPEDIVVATQGSFLLSRVLRKAAIIVDHSTRPLAPGDNRANRPSAASLERTSAWMQDLFCDENGQRMQMPYLTAQPRPPPLARTAPRPETFLELQRSHQSFGALDLESGSSSSANYLTGTGATDSSGFSMMEASASNDSLGSGPQAAVRYDSMEYRTALPPLHQPMSTVLPPGTSDALAHPHSLMFNGSMSSAAAPPTSVPVTAGGSIYAAPVSNDFIPVPINHPVTGGGGVGTNIAIANPGIPMASFTSIPLDLSSAGGGRDGPSLAQMGLGFFDTLFDSRNQVAPMLDPTVSLSQAEASTGATAATTASDPSAGDGGGSLPSAEAGVDNMGLEAYMNTFLTSIQGNFPPS